MIAASRVSVRIGSDRVAGRPESPLQRDPSVSKASLEHPSPGLGSLAPSASAGLPRNVFFFRHPLRVLRLSLVLGSGGAGARLPTARTMGLLAASLLVGLAGILTFLSGFAGAQAPDKMFAIVGYRVSGSPESGPVKWSDENPLSAPCSAFSDLARSVLISGTWITLIAGPTLADGVPIEGEYWITTETRPGEYAELHVMTTGRIFIRVEVHPADESAGEDGKCVVVSSSLSVRKTMYGPCSVDNLVSGDFVPVVLMRRSGDEGWSRGSGVYSKQLKAILTVRHVGELAPLIVMVWSGSGLAGTPAWVPAGVVKHFVCDVSGVCVSFIDSDQKLTETLDSTNTEWPNRPGVYSLVTPIAAKPEFLRVSGMDYPGLVVHERAWWPVIYSGCSGSGLFIVDGDFVRLVGVLSSGDSFKERETVIVSYVPVCPKDKDVWRAIREAQRVQEAKHAGEGD